MFDDHIVSTSNSSSLSEGAGTTRYKWDPKHSNLVEEVLDSIVDRYRRGELKDELRPDTLVHQLGGRFACFYHAACKRVKDRKSVV